MAETKPHTSVEAREVAEAARETEWTHPSFMAELFMGRFRPELVFPYPEQSEEDRRIGDEYIVKVKAFLTTHVNPDEIDRTGEMPAHVIKGLIELGCFAMKIPKEYGGLGFSQVNYGRTVSLISSYCASTAVWLSAHQSIGVPTPLKLFGTQEQKKKFFPRLAKGEISAFALTEPEVGSDPANMGTTAVPTDDGRHYILNGEKLWCTNGLIADLIVVMARTPSQMKHGKERKQITAFIVEKSMPGFEITYRCDFMGIRGIQNGLLQFRNVKVPTENILWGPGLGLKLALITLNTGRLTVPAACAGAAKQCLAISRRWGQARVQWGSPVGRLEAGAAKVSYIASHTFAMDSLAWLTSSMADAGHVDIRLEAAAAKGFCSETLWRIVDQTMQLRAGRGYEKAESLRGRGEPGYPVERMMRDARINTIFEGSTEILTLFTAREALDRHLKIAGEVLLNPSLTVGQRLTAAMKAGVFYAGWYPSQWVYWPWPNVPGGLDASLAGHLTFVHRTAHKLARTIFHCTMRYQAGLEKRQLILSRLVNVGFDLFAMTVACSRAQSLAGRHAGSGGAVELANMFCQSARRRIAAEFGAVWKNDDRMINRVAGSVLDGKAAWLERGVMPLEETPPTTGSSSSPRERVVSSASRS